MIILMFFTSKLQAYQLSTHFLVIIALYIVRIKTKTQSQYSPKRDQMLNVNSI